MLSTDPAAGSQVQPGSKITLQVSKGNKDSQLPDVTGADPQRGREQTLNGAGYNNIDVQGVTGSGQAPGVVADQKPSGGSNTDTSKKVTLYVERGGIVSGLLGGSGGN